MNKKRNIKGSNLPTVNISREIISVLSRLNGDEVKEIINGIRDYVYKDKEPNVNEEITDIMDMVLDNINHIARGYLNGKKGGRPKKSELQEVTTTEFDIPKNVENPNKADLSPSNDKEVEQPQPIMDNATESLKTAKNKDNPKNTENFENFLKIERNRINNIIDDFKAGGIRANIQAPIRLKELTNTVHGKIYEEELKTYIQEQVYDMAV